MQAGRQRCNQLSRRVSGAAARPKAPADAGWLSGSFVVAVQVSQRASHDINESWYCIRLAKPCERVRSLGTRPYIGRMMRCCENAADPMRQEQLSCGIDAIAPSAKPNIHYYQGRVAGC